MSRRVKRASAEATVPHEPATPWPLLAAIALVALVASITGITNGFAQDDAAIIVEDPRLHDLGLWREILRKPYWPPPYVADLYRPIASLLLAMQYTLGSGAP